MQLYNGKLRLQGSVLHEVRLNSVTAAEIIVLRELHGSDAVLDLAKTKMDKRSHAEERQRLQDKYANPRHTADQIEKRRTILRNLFGHDANPLPVTLADDEGIPQAPEPPKRTTIFKKGKADAEAGQEALTA